MANSSFFAGPSGKMAKKMKVKKSASIPSGKQGAGLLKGLGKGAIVLGGVFAALLVAGYFFIFKPTYALVSNVNDLKRDYSNIKDAMADRDLVQLEEEYAKAEEDLLALKEARDQNVGWMKDFGPTSEYYSDIDHFVVAGQHMIDAGREINVLLVPFADAGGFKISEDQEVQELELAEAFAQWVAIMPKIANDIDPVLEKLALAGEELQAVDASKYPEYLSGQPVRGTIEGAQTTLVALNDAGPDVKLALQVIPELMGVGTPTRRYMIMFQNDKELRATGGFWTYFSTFKLSNALLDSDFTSYGSYNIDFALEPIDPYIDFPDVPGAYQRHLKVERMFARDANISPDFPTAVDQFDYFWTLAQQQAPAQFKPVDGVFTIDTVVLEELLEVTGPVTLNGVTYSPDTVTLELEKLASLALQEQANRKKILGDLMEEMLVNVFESEKNLWPKLVDKGIDLAVRKHVQAWVFEPQAQVLLEKYNLAGRIVDPVEGDYAYWVSTNLGGGKTNTWFVNKVVDHKLEREGDRWVRTVTGNYTYETLGAEYDPFVVPYSDWVRLYVPAGAELISVEGSDDVTGTGEERNKTVFDAYVRIQPNTTKTLTFKYYLPDGVVGPEEYELYLQKQSGINTELHTVTVDGKTEEVELMHDENYATGL